MICSAVRYGTGYQVLMMTDEPCFITDARGDTKRYDMYHQALNKIVDMGAISVSNSGVYRTCHLYTDKAGFVYVVVDDRQIFTEYTFRNLQDAKEMIDHHLAK